MDFLAANHVRVVGLCQSDNNAKAHRADIFAIAQLSCLKMLNGDMFPSIFCPVQAPGLQSGPIHFFAVDIVQDSQILFIN